MREEGCDVRTWATFTDVSLHGCYVEAQATYPVGTTAAHEIGSQRRARGEPRATFA